MGQLWKSVDDVLDYAIAEEHKAVFVYRSFAKQAASAEVRKIFAGFMADEVEHFKKLLRMRKASDVTLSEGSLATLKPRVARLPEGELVEPEAAYRFAMRAEKSACELYTMLSQMAKEPEIRQMFETLAQVRQFGSRRASVWQSAGFRVKSLDYMADRVLAGCEATGGAPGAPGARGPDGRAGLAVQGPAG